MRKNIKTILAAVIFVIGILWLLSTVFVQRTVLNITDFKTVNEGEIEDLFEITGEYDVGEKTHRTVYKEAYLKGWTPSVGGQEGGYVFSVMPARFHFGDPPSPVPALCCIALGVVIYFLKRPRFLKLKKEQGNEQ